MSIVDANIAPMNPYQPLPFQISDRVLDSERLRIRASPALLRCVIEQDTFILA